MKFGILLFPGGHGDFDLGYVLEHSFNVEVETIWYQDAGPFQVDVLLIPGGFPCRESSSGFECFRETPALNYLAEFADQGKLIIGFGNGFQLLCEAGLLPGKLQRNSSGKFISKPVFVKPDSAYKAIDQLNTEKAYRIPIATYNGRFEAPEPELVQMRREQQIIFRYCDFAGRITESVNYTGSVDNIAGICNARKNVFGLIPQPERGIIGHKGFSDGKEVLKSLIMT